MRVYVVCLLAFAAMARAELPIKILYTFNPAVAIENIAQTSDGRLLLTTLHDNGRLYILNPNAANPTANVIATFPNCDGLTGVQETAPGVFAITAGPLGATGFESLTTFNVTVSSSSKPEATIRDVASIPDTAMLNGMATLQHNPAIILSCDSFRGTVVRINTITGEVETVIEDPLFKPTASVSLGINGLDVLDDFLYFTNSAQGIAGRMPIDNEGKKVGDIEILATLLGTPSRSNMFDDFALRRGCSHEKPEMLIAQWEDAVLHLKDGKETLWLGGGNSIGLQRPTSVIFSSDGKKAYIVTGAGQVVEVEI